MPAASASIARAVTPGAHAPAAVAKPGAAPHVSALRAFNRFYTRRIGVLDEQLYGTPFTLPQTRVLWELAHHEGSTASDLARALDLDPGYLSRLLTALKGRRLVRAQRSPADARQSLLFLSAAGRKAYAAMNAHSEQQVQSLLAPLDEPGRRRLLQATGTIESLLGAPRKAPAAPYLLRAPQPGDIGWVVARHGALYAAEYGWDITFEGLVAQIAGRFVEQFEAKREACWIAERDGENVGCIFLVQARDDKTNKPERGTAQLRLLIVEPGARGLGIGARLVAECERFARQSGYRRIKLWTQSNLLAARAIYAKAGYRLLSSEPHSSFGAELVAEVWELAL
jgi:DNA-binding MarR family transcriptional regulator/GNAT superfamily N-acetyltransferase